jgi:hypothetical protein
VDKKIKIIKKNAFLLKYLVNDILDFSQIKKGKMRINPANFKLKEIRE